MRLLPKYYRNRPIHAGAYDGVDFVNESINLLIVYESQTDRRTVSLLFLAQRLTELENNLETFSRSVFDLPNILLDIYEIHFDRRRLW